MTHMIKPTIETKNMAGTFTIIQNLMCFTAVQHFIKSNPMLNGASLRSPLNGLSINVLLWAEV